MLALNLAACSTGASGESASADGGELLSSALPHAQRRLPGDSRASRAADYPHTKVNFAFEGSRLPWRKRSGWHSADVFASANAEEHMDKVASLAVAPRRFTKNTLRLIVPPETRQASGIWLRRARRSWWCVPQVPCGAATASSRNTSASDRPIHRSSRQTYARKWRRRPTPGWSTSRMRYWPESACKWWTYPDHSVGMIYMLARQQAPSPEADQSFVDAVKVPRGRKILAGATGSTTGEGRKAMRLRAIPTGLAPA